MKAGKVYFWERTNSYVVKNSNNISNTNLGHTSRQRTGYVRFYDNTVNGNISIGAAEDNDDWPLTVKDCNINGHAENVLNKGLFLRCTISSATDNNSNSNWNTALNIALSKIKPVKILVVLTKIVLSKISLVIFMVHLI